VERPAAIEPRETLKGDKIYRYIILLLTEKKSLVKKARQTTGSVAVAVTETVVGIYIYIYLFII